MKLNSKLPNVGTTIFSVVSALAQQHEALNLGQGFPDFGAPQALLERLSYHALQDNHQYAPMTGVAALREQIALKVNRLYSRQVDADSEVTVVPGATEGIFSAIMALVSAGDEVIVFDPAYDSYEPSIQLAGASAVHIPLLAPDFEIDWQKLKDSLNKKTRMIILNSPHNPSGSTLSNGDLELLAELVRDTDIVVLSDEVYEHLVYDQKDHCSLLTHDELYQRTIVVSSFGKTYHVTGWKTGYCVAPPSLTAELRKVHQFVTFVAVTPIQLALADFMRDFPEYCLQLPTFYQQKRDLFCQAMQGSKFSFKPTAGSFFQLMDYSELSDLKDTEMVEWLIKDVKVAAIPISVFYQQPPSQRILRFCFAKQETTLLEAARRLSSL